MEKKGAAGNSVCVTDSQEKSATSVMEYQLIAAGGGRLAEVDGRHRCWRRAPCDGRDGRGKQEKQD